MLIFGHAQSNALDESRAKVLLGEVLDDEPYSDN